jgi:hypothetical protein
MAATLTAQDIARHIQRPGENLTAAVDRLRNWTKEGLIQPVGDLRPGTGRKKRYAEIAITKAVIIQILADATGGAAGYLAAVADELAPMLLSAYRNKYMVVISRKSGVGRFSIALWDEKLLGKEVFHSPDDVHIVLNPHRILDRLRKASP